MIVLDSSFLISFYNQRDAHHAAAKALMDRFLAGEWGQGLLLEYIFLEVVTVLLARRGLSTAAQVGSLLLDAVELDFVSCAGLFAKVWEMFTHQGNAYLSFADMAVAVAAQERASGWVLTFDKELGKLPGIRVPA